MEFLDPTKRNVTLTFDSRSLTLILAALIAAGKHANANSHYGHVDNVSHDALAQATSLIKKYKEGKHGDTDAADETED